MITKMNGSRLHLALLAAGAVGLAATAAQAAGGVHIERQQWSFSGFTGHYDKAQLQRGFQIYQNVCSGCHGLSRLSFRNLVQPGGPEFPEEAVKSLAAGWANQIPTETDTGEGAVATKGQDGKVNGFKYVTRPATLADPILGPYRNEAQARAGQGGALPPDLSVIAKARGVEYIGNVWGHPLAMLSDIAHGYQEGGADYIYALLNGYRDTPPPFKRDGEGRLHEVPESEAGDASKILRCTSVDHGEHGKPDTCNTLQDGMSFNIVFPGHQIAMGKPLDAGSVTYDKDKDGKPVAPETLDQYARDIAAFLSWASDPSLNSRKYIGWQVMLYLLFTTLLLYAGKRHLWSKVH